MSKKGKTVIEVPSDVSIELCNGIIKVSGPRGILTRNLSAGIDISVENGVAKVSQSSETKNSKAMHGLERSLVNNMVIGVNKGFSKMLKMVGTGYKVYHKGDYLDLSLMKSHPVHMKIPEGIEVKVEGTTKMQVWGNDKQQVGQMAADISSQIKKDPYKGKGIYIEGEYIRRKAGKSKKK